MTTKSHTARQRRRAPWATKAGPTLQTLRKLRARGWGTRKTNCISLRSAFLQNIGGIPRLPRKRTRAQRLRPRQARNETKSPRAPQLLLFWRALSRRSRAPWATKSAGLKPGATEKLTVGSPGHVRKTAPLKTKGAAPALQGPTLQTLRKLRARGWGTRKTFAV